MAAIDPEIPRPPAGPRLPDELISSTTFLLKRLGFAAKDRAIEAYDKAGLSPYHHAVLAVLAEGSRETQGEIADALRYDRGQLVRLLDELEEQGLIERRRDPADRRRHAVVLTDKGRRTHADLRDLARRLEDEFLAGLDDEQRSRLYSLLLALAVDHLPHCRFAPRAT